ncbi:MAG TPA: phage tail protein [Allosphingosinicella sp.]|jgi:hypothetical protein
MLLAFGMFLFELGTAPYEDLSRKLEARHGSTARFGARPASQYLGPGDETISLAGRLLPPLTGNGAQLDARRAMTVEGRSWPLVDGLGRVLGNFVLTSVDERQSNFLDNGVPRKTDFTLELRRVD